MEQIKEKSMEPKTPYYVIHREEIDVNFKKLENALKKYWNNYIIGYSYKTNALPWIIKHFDSMMRVNIYVFLLCSMKKKKKKYENKLIS